MSRPIALVVSRNQGDFSAGTVGDEEALLAAELSARGHRPARVLWDDPEVDWTRFDAVILKAPWDYHDRILEFRDWLERLRALGLPVFNPVDRVLWNADKAYLLDIEAAGLPIVPTELLRVGEMPEWERYLDRWQTDSLVLKPRVNAGGKNTRKVTAAELERNGPAIAASIDAVDHLVQPYERRIEEGEHSFLFFGGRFSHAVVKRPRPGDFRVQHYLGGSYEVVEPSRTTLRQAERHVSLFAADCLYARVDGILDGEEFRLMELELIEPYLFLPVHREGVGRYVDALEERLEADRAAG